MVKVFQKEAYTRHLEFAFQECFKCLFLSILCQTSPDLFNINTVQLCSVCLSHGSPVRTKHLQDAEATSFAG